MSEMYRYQTFVINLASATERRSSIERQLNGLQMPFEIVDAIDGKALGKETEWGARIDWQWADANAFWVSKGLLACTLSHLKACQAIVDQELDYGLILEDDTWLAPELPDFLAGVGETLKNDEVILLYYAAWSTFALAAAEGWSTPAVPHVRLLHPLKPKDVITANAYILSREACQRILAFQTPMKATSDSWGVYLENNALAHVRCAYPQLAKAADFKSTIDYIPANSLKGRVLAWVDRYQIPVVYQYLKYRRRKLREGMLSIKVV